MTAAAQPMVEAAGRRPLEAVTMGPALARVAVERAMALLGQGVREGQALRPTAAQVAPEPAQEWEAAAAPSVLRRTAAALAATS
jgi:hypothetical protein